MDLPATSPDVAARRAGLIVLALAVGGFAIGVSEFAMMGLMQEIMRDLGVDKPRVGHLISAYALGVVVGAPLLAVMGARYARKSLLLALMAFYALGNLGTALAPGYLTLLGARFVAGLPHGAYFGVAMLVAASVSPADRRGVAVSRVLLGLSVAILVGNPLATWMGQQASWRWTYVLVSALSLLTVVMVWRVLPWSPPAAGQAPGQELRAFNRPQVWLTLAIAAIGFSGMFCVLSYLSPTLTDITGQPESLVPVGLAAFGVGSIIGTLASGWLVDRMQFRATAVVLAWSVLVLLLFPWASRQLWTALPAITAVGTMGALAPILQTRLMDVAGRAQTLAAASNHAAFNAANALGPWLGGLAIAHGLGLGSTGYVGAATALGGLALYAWARRIEAGAARIATPG